MPLRTYSCSKCGLTKDVLEPTDAPATRPCDCWGNAHGTMERQVSAPGGFNLKGDGFYKPGFA